MISPEEEAELSVRIRNGDHEALQKLVLANLRFVVSVAKKYQNQGLAFPDLINEGNVGLVKAATKFDETRGFKFISYAVWWIRQSIIQAISYQTRIVRLPLNRISSINKISKASIHLEQQFERAPSHQELAEFLDMPMNEIDIANSIKRRQLSLDMQLTDDGISDFDLNDILAAGESTSPDYHLGRESLMVDIERALNKLSDREADILTMSFGLLGTPVRTQQDIALKFGMTTERIRQIRFSALQKLKTILKKYSVQMIS